MLIKNENGKCLNYEKRKYWEQKHIEKGNREIDKNLGGINWKYTSMPSKMWLGFSTTAWYWLYNYCNSSFISL